MTIPPERRFAALDDAPCKPSHDWKSPGISKTKPLAPKFAVTIGGIGGVNPHPLKSSVGKISPAGSVPEPPIQSNVYPFARTLKRTLRVFKSTATPIVILDIVKCPPPPCKPISIKPDESALPL